MTRPARGSDSGGATRAAHRNASVPSALRAAKGGIPAGKRSTVAKAKATPVKARRKRSTVPPPYAPGRITKGRRYAVTYDLEGPIIRRGIAWAVAVVVAMGLGRLAFDLPLASVLFSGVAAVAAGEIVDVWVTGRVGAVRGAASGGAALIGLSAIFGARALGAALLLVVATSLLVGVFQATRRTPIFVTACLVLQSAVPVGLVAASFELTISYEIGAAIVLLVMVMAFDLGDFIVGSGAASVIEGPLAGSVAVAIVAGIIAVIAAPPFDGVAVWPFAFGVMVLCPTGQVLASALLPDASTRSGSLRRLDSLLVVAPLWALSIGVFVAHR